MLVNARIANHGELPARAGAHVDQDAVSLRGLIHPEGRELRLRRRDGVRRFMTADEHADFARGSFLALRMAETMSSC